MMIARGASACLQQPVDNPVRNIEFDEIDWRIRPDLTCPNNSYETWEVREDILFPQTATYR